MLLPLITVTCPMDWMWSCQALGVEGHVEHGWRWLSASKAWSRETSVQGDGLDIGGAED